MKTKLEVVKASVDSVKFGLGNIPTILRLGWLGALLYIIVYAGGILLAYGAAFGAIAANGDWQAIASLTNSFTFHAANWLFAILASLMVVPFTVAIRRIAAGDMAVPGGVAYFRLGGREIKFFLSQIIISIFIGLFSAVVLIPALVTFLMGVLQGVTLDMLMDLERTTAPLERTVEGNMQDGGNAMLIAGIVLLIIGLIATIWFSIRACLFTTAAAIESNPVPFGSFGLTGGNVWRIIGATILLFLMLMLVYLVFMIAIGIAVAILAGIVMASGEASGVLAAVFGIVGGLAGVVALVAFLCAAIGIEQAFPAKIYASLTRGRAAPSEATVPSEAGEI